MNNYPLNGIYKAAAILTCFVFSVGLFSYALAGTTSRYLQDDFCYSNILRGDNFFIEQYNSYMHETTYSANRFSLTLGMGLSELAGPGSVSVLPGLMLSAWLFGLYSLIRRISRQNILVSLNRLDAFIISEALALFTLSMAPNWIQSFFWRPGLFPYFAPLVTGTYLILLMLIAGQAAKWRRLLLLGVFLLAILTGGFSETAVCVEMVLLAVIFGISCLLNSTRRFMSLPAGIALLGSAVAMALLIASPTNAARLALSYGAASSLPSTIVNSLKGGIYFYLSTAYRPTLLYASALVFFSLLGLITSSRHEKPPLSWKQFAIGLFASIVIAYLLTAAALAPSFYAESSYPGNRALIIPRFVSILLATAAGFLTGNFLSGWSKDRMFSIVVILAGVGIIFINALWLSGMTKHFFPPAYPDMRSFLKLHIGFGVILVAVSTIFLGLVFIKYKTRVTLTILVLIYLIQPGLMGARIIYEYPILRQRAALWDWRQSQIITARDNGESDITVRALDSLVGLTDLSGDQKYWVNKCAAKYYGLHWINAVEPVLDAGQLFNP
jgi:hypothetical protein